MSNQFRWDAQNGEYVNVATPLSGEMQMPNAGLPSESWVPSDAVMIQLLRYSLKQETRDRLKAERSVRLQENVTELLIMATRECGKQQEAEILALHSELAETRRELDHTRKRICELADIARMSYVGLSS